MSHRPLVVTISPRAVMTITPQSAPEAEHGTESEYNDGPPDSDSGPRSKKVLLLQRASNTTQRTADVNNMMDSKDSSYHFNEECYY